MVDPVSVYRHQEDAAFHIGKVYAHRGNFFDFLFVFLDGFRRDFLNRKRVIPLFQLFARNVIRAFGQQFRFKRGVQFRFVPKFRHVVRVHGGSHHFFHVIGDIFQHLIVYVFALEHFHTLRVHHFALLVHHVVVLEHVFTDAEVSAFDCLLRVCDAVRKHFRLQTGIFVDFEKIVKRFHSFAAETLYEIVFERKEEHGHTDIALTPGTAAQLIIDTAGFVALGADDAKTAGGDYLFLFLIRFRLIMFVYFFIAFAERKNFIVYVGNVRADGKFDIFVRSALFAEALFGEVFGVAAQQNIRAAPRHVGGDGYGAESACLRYDFRFAFVVFRV